MGNDKKPLISVVIPVFNAARYLEACFASLQKQTYKNLQFVFVNDASTDDSLQKLKEFKEKDDRVIIVDQERNKGVSAARNAGLDACTGAYIGFCDADDTCEPEMFDNMLASAQREHAQIACCAIRRVAEDGEVLCNLWEAPADTVMSSIEATKNWLIGKYIGNSVYTKLIKRELLEGIRFPEGEIFEEAKVIPQLFAKAERIVHCGTVVYNYFCRSNSITRKPVDERVLNVYAREDYIREFVLLRHPDLQEEMEYFEIRMNLSLMMSAEIDKHSIDKNLYSTIKQKFQAVLWRGLQNRYVSLKEKIHLIEIKLKLFYLRKHYLHM